MTLLTLSIEVDDPAAIADVYTELEQVARRQPVHRQYVCLSISSTEEVTDSV